MTFFIRIAVILSVHPEYCNDNKIITEILFSWIYIQLANAKRNMHVSTTFKRCYLQEVTNHIQKSCMALPSMCYT
jgi:hypothetical protein